MNANRVRIVGGRYRSRILRFPPRPGLRPSPDRVRETLFNWLGHDLSGRDCADLFAGSGALGFEAVSRGASHVLMIERDRQTWQALRDNAVLLGCGSIVEVRRSDALEFARTADRAFDIVFLDPPFAAEILCPLAAVLPRLIRPGGLVYIESARGFDLDAPWQLQRQGRAGQVTYQLYSHGDQ